MTDNLRGAVFMIVSMAAFTAGDACMKAVSAVVPLYQAITLRGIITVFGLFVISQFAGGLRLPAVAASWRVVLVRSLAELAATVCFFLALMRLPLATVSSIMQSLPLAMTLAAAVFLRERVGWRRMTAIGVGFVGVILIVRPGAADVSPWVLAALLAMLSVVVRDLASRKLPPGVPSVTVALAAAILVTLMGAVGSLAQPWVAVSTKAAALIVAAAAFVIVGYVFIIRVMRVGEIGVTSQFRYTALIWAVLLGWLAFDEWPDAMTLIGGTIVVATGLFTLARERRLGLRAAAQGPQA